VVILEIEVSPPLMVVLPPVDDAIVDSPGTNIRFEPEVAVLLVPTTNLILPDASSLSLELTRTFPVRPLEDVPVCRVVHEYVF